ncbi:hypothetical protein FRC07_003565 [Ceratobasidium sp. 392]|nr:hypothetical protein FRC07_003565 [Ceratobasidium sp. 392]
MIKLDISAELMDRMEDIGVWAIKNDPLTVPTVAAQYSERPDLYHKFVRMQLEVGLIGGQLYGAFSSSDATPESLVGLSLWYEPGTEFMASDEEHGPWDTYMKDILPETKQWWDEIADAAEASSCLETNSEDNVKFYMSLGFEVKGSVLMPSRFGDFTMTCMHRSPRSATLMA